MDRQAFEAAFCEQLEKIAIASGWGKSAKTLTGFKTKNALAEMAPKPLVGWKTKAALAGGTLFAANRIGAAQERQKIQQTSPYARLSGNF